MRVYQFRHLGWCALMYAGKRDVSTALFAKPASILPEDRQDESGYASTSFEATVESAFSR